MIPGEVLVSPFFTEGMAVFTTGDESYAERRTGIRNLFDHLALVPHNAKAGDSTGPAPTAIGLKVAYQRQEEAADLANAIREFFPNLRIILVVRDDLVAQHGSLLLAQQTGKWHSWKGEKDAQTKKTLRIPAEDFRSYADGIRRGMSHLEGLSSSHRILKFSYERDICEQPAYEKLYRFLDIDCPSPDWVRMKKAAPPPESFIENYGELQTALGKLPPIDQAEQDGLASARFQDWLKKQRPYFQISRANELTSNGQHAKAIQICASILLNLENLRPVQVRRLFSILSAAGRKSGDIASINEAIENLSKTYRDDEDMHVLMTERDIAQGNVAEAIQRMADMLETHPDWELLRGHFEQASKSS